MASQGLQFLPVELLYEIQLFALSPSLPVASRHIQAVFRGTTPLYRAQYLMGRQLHHDIEPDHVLRYPLCSPDVLPHIMQMLREDLSHVPAGLVIFRLPRCLFRPLAPLADRAQPRTETAHPLPFLKQLYYTADFARLNASAYDGYALTKAVHAHFVPLIRFLLALGADPAAKDGLAVTVAIRRKDLGLVLMLVEHTDDAKKRAAAGKRSRVGDRVVATNAMLRTAVKCDARDIVQYFTEKKGLVPDLRTLSTLPAFVTGFARGSSACFHTFRLPAEEETQLMRKASRQGSSCPSLLSPVSYRLPSDGDLSGEMAPSIGRHPAAFTKWNCGLLQLLILSWSLPFYHDASENRNATLMLPLSSDRSLQYGCACDALSTRLEAAIVRVSPRLPLQFFA